MLYCKWPFLNVKRNRTLVNVITITVSEISHSANNTLTVCYKLTTEPSDRKKFHSCLYNYCIGSSEHEIEERFIVNFDEALTVRDVTKCA